MSETATETPTPPSSTPAPGTEGESAPVQSSSTQSSPSGSSPPQGAPADGAKTKGPDLQSVWRESRELLWRWRGRLVIGLVLLVIGRIAGLVTPASAKWIIDDVIGNGRLDLLWPIATAAAIAAVLSAGTGFALSILLGVAAQRAINDLRLKVQAHVARLPVRYFEEHKTGELITRVVNDAEGIRNLVGSGFVQLVGGALSASISMAVLFYLNWMLTLMTLFFLGAFAFIMAKGFASLRPLFRERNKLLADINGRLTEMFGGIRVVKAYTSEKREQRIFAHNTHAMLRMGVKSMVGVSTINSIAGLLFGMMGLTMGILGAYQVVEGKMTTGDLVTYVLFTGMMVAPLVQISSIGTQITEAFAGLDRIREVLREDPEWDYRRRGQRVRKVQGDVVFDDVTFAYKPGVPVLKNVSFKAPAGTTTALVGPSGAGKSTIISLVMAFNRPQEGRILVDGTPLVELDTHDFRSHLGIVLQDNFLFDGTVRENIAYSRPTASDEEVLEAARIAHCDDFVRGFPQGYETTIGERGVKVSGGQRQRLAIARAILADPAILILDEATSSLDSESEEKIQDGLEQLLQGRTTFVIAHRLSTIRNADQILVLDDGVLVERGTHDELLDLEGRYKDLYDRQYRLELNRFINPGEDFTPKLKKARPEAPKNDRRPQF
ncbi:MAG: ABC transporter ATP-binding protein [Acidobacteriota bacterium]